MEKRVEAAVTFVGEQDGAPERNLKLRMRDILSQFPSVQRAYLARARYAGSAQPWVALCVYGTLESAEIAAACSRPFQEIFNCTQSLDILFAGSEQDVQLAKVCQPFYKR